MCYCASYEEVYYLYTEHEYLSFLGVIIVKYLVHLHDLKFKQVFFFLFKIIGHHLLITFSYVFLYSFCLVVQSKSTVFIQ